MKRIKIWFSDFYLDFDPEDNPFYNLLSEKYDLLLDQNDPEYLIYSCYGQDFLKYNCVRIYYTGENLRPDFNLCDFAIGFDYLNFEDRYLRFPNFALFEKQFSQLTLYKELQQIDVDQKKHFCNFIYSNSFADPTRDQFFHLLSNYKKIASPGGHLNNISFPIGDRFSTSWMFDKIEFQSNCKFSIAFENSTSPGYTTEKLLHSFVSRTIPIYWGNPEVVRDFNSRSFINCHDFNSLEEVVKRVIDIDQNDELYLSIVNEPPFRENNTPPGLLKQNLENFFDYILALPLEEAVKRPKYGSTLNYEVNLKKLIDNKSQNSKYNPLSRLKKTLKSFLLFSSK